MHTTVYSDETMCTPLYESWLLDWINHIPPTLSPTLKILPLAGQTSLGRISGPYPLSQFPLRCTVAGFGVIPKNHQPNKWHLIIDLSHPQGNSINDGIPQHLCSLSYVSVDDAILNILQSGKGTTLVKIDIKSAFRLCPVHRTDRHLLAMKWKEYIYIDRCTPFGLRSAPKLFDILADILSWIAQKRRISYVIHYLDDFLTMGPPSFPICQQNQNTFIGWCSELGVPFPPTKWRVHQPL